MDQTDTQSSKPKQADSEGETHSFLFGSHAWQNRSDKPTWCYLPSTAVQTRNVTEWPGEHSEASSALKSSIFFLVERLQTHCDVCCLFVDYCFEVWHYCLYFLKPRPQVGNRGKKSREKKGDFLISSHEIGLHFETRGGDPFMFKALPLHFSENSLHIFQSQWWRPKDLKGEGNLVIQS